MAARQLVVLARFGDALSADTLVAFLRAHDIDAHVEGVDPFAFGLGGRIRVVLAEEDLRRARWAMAKAEGVDATDAERWFVATGELDAAAAKSAFARSEHGPAPQMQNAVRKTGIGIVLVIAIAILALLSR